MRRPDYNRIYLDILQRKFPEKLEQYRDYLLTKSKLSVLDVVRLNESIFGKAQYEDQKYRSYDKATIIEILEYQKKNRLNNTQLAQHFRLSRNTVASWKKKFIV